MDKVFQESLLHVCSLLNRNKVEYLIVGGTAVAVYGYYRMSITASGKPSEKPDLDFWYNPTYENYYKLLRSIAEMGIDVSRYKNESTPNPKKSFFKLNFEQYTVDFIPELPGLHKFNQSFLKKEVIMLHGTEIFFIDIDDLIENKLSIAREKDLEDVDQLRKIYNKYK